MRAQVDEPSPSLAVAGRSAEGGYRVTLVARSTDGLGELAGTLADTGAQIDTASGDASDPDDLGVRIGRWPPSPPTDRSWPALRLTRRVSPSAVGRWSTRAIPGRRSFASPASSGNHFGPRPSSAGTVTGVGTG
jgi:hypothetical protein